MQSSDKTTRRGFIKLSGTTLLIAGLLRVDKVGIFKCEYDPVVITPDDFNGALEFWTHFDGKIPPKLLVLKQEMDRLGYITPELQHEIKVNVLREIAFSGIPAFEDELFVDIKQECKRVLKEIV